ncbi:ATP-dependent DNA helicase [Cylindrobasidium torrendii FP15055 ss-10]|uniref:ATP-dependent DNA helicase n=1 Tax=Cylindrobasidium torrendii FP15055 ss-10 TaxID=1314674 RepID=A0A0D7B996_9AGAR|nr:ATP-dependent DNA helicase [Cylindrobasidium torrendii FP15055 ss-10]
MDKAHIILHDVFGHDSFRLLQEQVVKRLVEDNDNALCIFPTGGGKSLTFQVPALCFEGITLVISPLIALMKDQVESLQNKGIMAANLDSSQDAAMTRIIKHDTMNNKLKLLYVAPERLNNEGFVEMMRNVKISLLAVDEAHCISQWGTSFRPEYLKIARFAEEMNVERVLCLTATATKEVIEDICVNFLIDEHGVFKTPVYRPNLGFCVDSAPNFDSKVQKAVALLKKRTGPAIVYVTLQKHAEEAAIAFRRHGLEAAIYHAGLPQDERTRIQQNFMASKDGIVCATIAFGMGIDKADIRQVIHMYMPKTLEGYSQEVGRAGRDGLPSTCLMILSPPDIPILEGFCRGDTVSPTSLKLWLQEVALKDEDGDGTISFNHYTQAREFDIKDTVLRLLYAQLELKHGFFRAVTPFYAIYDLKELSAADWQKVMKDNTKPAQAIRAGWTRKTAGYQVDVMAVVAASGISREQIARTLSMWELEGLLESKPSQVRNRYRVIKPLPTDLPTIGALADQMFEEMVAREEDGVRRIQGVIEFATASKCLAVALAEYFGDVGVVPNEQCGVCSFCKTGQSLSFNQGTTFDPDPVQVASVLSTVTIRDDPRCLARFAFGVSSPRLYANKWTTKHPLFGCLVDADFKKLLEVFDVECRRVDYVNVAEDSANRTTGTKRSYSGGSSYPAKSSTRGRSTSGSSSYSSGRGRGRGSGTKTSYASKRGRY